MVVDLATGAATAMPDTAVSRETLLTSTDGTHAYVMATGTLLQLLSGDLATGTEVDRITLPGSGLGPDPMERALVLPDDGILVATDTALVRIDDDGTGGLAEASRSKSNQLGASRRRRCRRHRLAGGSR